MNKLTPVAAEARPAIDAGPVLYRLLDRFNRAAALEEIYAAALDAILDGLGCARAAILLFDEAGAMRFVASHGLSSGYCQAVEGHSPWKMGDLDPTPILVHDMEASHEAPDIKRCVREEGIGALAFVPIVAERRAIGKFMVYRNEVHRFSDAEIDLAVAIALQLSFCVEKKRARKRLAQNEEHLRTLFENAGAGMTVMTSAGLVKSANEACAQMADRAPSDLIGASWFDLTHRDDLPANHRALETVSKSSDPIAFDQRLIGKNGAAKWVRVTLSDIGQGQILAIVEDVDARRSMEAELRGLNEDLEARVAERTRELEAANRQLLAEADERLRVETAARQTTEQFRILVEGVVDYAIYMLDPAGRVATWNAGARRAKGYDEEEILGRHFSVFYTPEAQAADEPGRALKDAREIGRVEMQGWRLRKDGSRFWAHIVIDALRDRNGALIGYAKVTRDATEQRNAAQSLEEARAALFQSQKMDAVGQLTGGIAHDFNNMLAGIIGALQLLERRLDAGRYDDTRRYINVALDSANRAAALTTRLLAFGRRQSLDIKPVDINETIAAMELLLRRSASENMSIELDLADEDIWARTDAHQLESALLNLAINARDAMPEGGQLTLSSRREESFSVKGDGPYVVICVADTGVGMSQETVSRAFEPFFTTKPMGAGTGLGLSMVHGFINQSGGHVVIESAQGAGARIHLYLPEATKMDIDAHATSIAQTPEDSGEIVLVVEDEGAVRLLIGDVVSDLGYTAKLAANADDAIPILQSRERIDLMISDVGLPGLNGRQLADIARQSRPNLDILFLTGYAEHAAIRSEFLTPGMDLMKKPFAVEDLAQKVRSILCVKRALNIPAP